MRTRAIDWTLQLLFFWAQDDEVSPIKDMVPTAEHFSRTTVIVFDQGGHAPYMEHPEVFAEALAWFGDSPSDAHTRTDELALPPGVHVAGFGNT